MTAEPSSDAPSRAPARAQSTALARVETVALLGDVLSRDDARRFVAARDAAVKCCNAMTASFGWKPQPEPPQLPQTASDGQLDAYRNLLLCERATWVFENTARLRGAMWAEVTLRGVLQRNAGDLDAQRALQALRTLLYEHWWAPSVTQKTLDAETRRPWRGAVQTSKARKGPPPAPRPWECVVLGVDTARRSGWSVWTRGARPYASGELDTLDTAAVRMTVARAVDIARILGLPCVLVLEKPYGGNVHVVAALGAAAERWLCAWRELATGHVGKVVRVQPVTWRAAVLGKEAHGLNRDDVRALEQRVARGILQLPQGAVLGADEAPGVLIGCWGSRAGEVGEVLSRKAQKQSLKAWTAPR